MKPIDRMADSYRRYDLVREFLLAKGIKEAPLNRILRKYYRKVVEPAVTKALIEELAARFAEKIDAEILRDLMATPLQRD